MADLQEMDGLAASLPPCLIAEPGMYYTAPALRETAWDIVEYFLTKASAVKNKTPQIQNQEECFWLILLLRRRQLLCTDDKAAVSHPRNAGHRGPEPC